MNLGQAVESAVERFLVLRGSASMTSSAKATYAAELLAKAERLGMTGHDFKAFADSWMDSKDTKPNPMDVSFTAGKRVQERQRRQFAVKLPDNSHGPKLAHSFVVLGTPSESTEWDFLAETECAALMFLHKNGFEANPGSVGNSPHRRLEDIPAKVDTGRITLAEAIEKVRMEE